VLALYHVRIEAVQWKNSGSPTIRATVTYIRVKLVEGTSMPHVKRILHVANPWLKFLILAGTVTYVIEIASGASAIQGTHSFFWWIYCFISVCFTLEYIVRWVDDAQDEYGWHYPPSAIGIIDFISIAPFWISFFLPADWLQLVRTLRVFQLLKFFRYSRSLQLVALGFYRAAPRFVRSAFPCP